MRPNLPPATSSFVVFAGRLRGILIIIPLVNLIVPGHLAWPE